MSEKAEKKLNLFDKIDKIKKEVGGAVKKKSENAYFSSNYADLNTHLDLLEPVLQANKVLLMQPVKGDKVFTTLLDLEDENNGSYEVYLKLPELDDMQKIGGAITYARRYLLNSLFALKAEDDDGETAVGRGGKNSKPKEEKKQYKKPSKTFKKPVAKKEEIKEEEEEEIF